MADLMTPSGAWNVELIKQSFAAVDAHAILSTPAKGTGPDGWAWEPERHGLYKVRSAYRRLFDDHCQQREMDQASVSGDPTWMRIWRLCVPLKVHVFWWRVVNGYLPTRGVLHHRHIEPTANCEVCGAEVESIKHALLDCTVAKAFWAQVRMMTGVKVPQLHPVTWARDLVDPDVFPAKSVAVVLRGMWSLWMSRNKKRHGERDVPVKVAVQWAIDTAFDLWQILHPAKPAAAMANTQRSWQKPPPGWFKCNVGCILPRLEPERGLWCGTPRRKWKIVWREGSLVMIIA